jgi:hypothetical protein
MEGTGFGLGYPEPAYPYYFQGIYLDIFLN